MKDQATFPTTKILEIWYVETLVVRCSIASSEVSLCLFTLRRLLRCFSSALITLNDKKFNHVLLE
jgi:hypothetical protein